MCNLLVYRKGGGGGGGICCCCCFIWRNLCVRDCLNRIFGDFISSSPSHWKLLQSICLRVDHFLFLNVTIFYPSSKTCLNVGKKINAIRHCWSSVSVPSSLKKKKILSFPNFLWMALPDIWLDSRDNNKNWKGNSFEKKKMSKILTKVYRDKTLLPPLQESKLFFEEKVIIFPFFLLLLPFYIPRRRRTFRSHFEWSLLLFLPDFTWDPRPSDPNRLSAAGGGVYDIQGPPQPLIGEGEDLCYLCGFFFLPHFSTQNASQVKVSG